MDLLLPKGGVVSQNRPNIGSLDINSSFCLNQDIVLKCTSEINRAGFAKEGAQKLRKHASSCAKAGPQQETRGD